MPSAVTRTSSHRRLGMPKGEVFRAPFLGLWVRTGSYAFVKAFNFCRTLRQFWVKPGLGIADQVGGRTFLWFGE